MGIVEDGTESWELGSGRECLPVVDAMGLGEALGTIPGLVDRLLTWQLLHSEHPQAFKNDVVRRGDNVNE
ncbi:hypothetical protein CLOM_g5376 [Closterium sp. NIES-68]|nr:hypothetical protein CLOM_g5376 [Closterium sp. NIES-68]